MIPSLTVDLPAASSVIAGDLIPVNTDGGITPSKATVTQVTAVAVAAAAADATSKANAAAAASQPLDADLTSIAALATTSYGRSFLPLADAAAARTLVGVVAVASSGSASDLGTGTLPIARVADAAVTYAKIQNVSATDKLLGRSSSGAGVTEEIACTAAGRALIDDTDAAAQRTTLGLGTAATSATSAFDAAGAAATAQTAAVSAAALAALIAPVAAPSTIGSIYAAAWLAGSFTVGMWFKTHVARTCTGIKFWAKYTGSKTLKCSIYTSASGTPLATVDVALDATAGLISTATFASPLSLAATPTADQYYATVWEKSAAVYPAITGAQGADYAGTVGYFISPGVLCKGLGWIAGDAKPTNNLVFNSTSYYLVEPVFSA